MNNYNKPFECRHETRQNDTYFNKNCFRVLWFFSLDKIHQETKQKLHPWFHELEKLMVNYNGYGLLMNIFFYHMYQLHKYRFIHSSIFI